MQGSSRFTVKQLPDEFNRSPNASTIQPPSQAKERVQLRKLLSRPYFSNQLDSLTAVALASSSGSDMNAKYEPLIKPVCDGFEIRFGKVPQFEAMKMKGQIISLLHMEL